MASRAARSSDGLDQLLALIDEAFDRRAWHGKGLLRAIRGLTPAQAAWRPAPRRNSIHDIVLHAAYWKLVVERRLTGRRSPFVVKGHDWFDTRTRDWLSDVRLLRDTHRRLRKVVEKMPVAALEQRIRANQTAAFTIRGIAAHDLYHAGQIQLLTRLLRLGR